RGPFPQFSASASVPESSPRLFPFPRCFQTDRACHGQKERVCAAQIDVAFATGLVYAADAAGRRAIVVLKRDRAQRRRAYWPAGRRKSALLERFALKRTSAPPRLHCEGRRGRVPHFRETADPFHVPDEKEDRNAGPRSP